MKCRRTHPFVGGITALAVLLTACGTAGSPNDPPSAAPVTATVTAKQTATSTATATRTETATVTPSTQPTTGRPSPAPTTPPRSTPAPDAAPTPDPVPPLSDAEIVAEANKAFGVVDTYWRNLFSQWEVEWWTPDRFHEDGFYDSARGFYADCDVDFDTVFNAFFCGSSFTGTGFVAWDMEFLRAESEIGNAPIYHTVSHEIGHAAQTRFWHDDEGGATPHPDSGEYEVQADCLAGASMGRAEREGYLFVAPGDLAEIEVDLRHFNDSGGDHGTDAQRVDAFSLGYDTGDVESCLYNEGVPPPGFPLT